MGKATKFLIDFYRCNQLEFEIPTHFSSRLAKNNHRVTETGVVLKKRLRISNQIEPNFSKPLLGT